MIKHFFKKIFNLFFEEDYGYLYVNFICGNEALPSPLEAEEEEQYLKMLNSEDREFACNKLIEHNLRLVIYIVKKFENSGAETEDLISIGSIGLIKAVKSFDYDKKIKLATYASRCIENEILMYFRKLVKRKADISLDEPLNVDYDGNELLLSDLLASDEETSSQRLEKNEEKDYLYLAIDKLNPQEKSIMEMRFGLNGENELTQKQVAQIMGISQSYISRLEKKIFVRLKKDLSKFS